MTPPQTLVRPLIHQVAAERRVSYDDIVNPLKTRRATAARREVWRRLRAQGYSLAAIGRAWGCHHYVISKGLSA